MSLINDPIGDLLTRIRNAQAADSSSCRAPHSRIKRQLLDLLVREGWIKAVAVEGTAPKQELIISFHTDRAALTLKRESKPGRRIYRPVDKLKRVLHGFGMAIITTNQGLLTDREARAKGVGGELLCTIS